MISDKDIFKHLARCLGKILLRIWLRIFIRSTQPRLKERAAKHVGFGTIVCSDLRQRSPDSAASCTCASRRHDDAQRAHRHSLPAHSTQAAIAQPCSSSLQSNMAQRMHNAEPCMPTSGPHQHLQTQPAQLTALPQQMGTQPAARMAASQHDARTCLACMAAAAGIRPPCAPCHERHAHGAAESSPAVAPRPDEFAWWVHDDMACNKLM